METFESLVFEGHKFGLGLIARKTFDNGWGVSVITGHHTYGGDEGLYELAVLKKDKIDYDNPVANGDVVGWLTPEKVTELMETIQSFEKV